MKNELDTISLLKAAERKSIKRALEAKAKGQFNERVKWEARARYIAQQRLSFELLVKTGVSVPQIVFFSYSVESGQLYYNHLEFLLSNQGFEVLTGFQKSEDDEGNILKRVLRQIEKSTIFLGLLTKEHKIPTHEEIKWSPSVWTVEEKGMALAMKKPFVLMIEDGVHDDFWRKTAPHRVHIFFESTNFHKKANEVVEAVNDRYNEFARKILNS